MKSKENRKVRRYLRLALSISDHVDREETVRKLDKMWFEMNTEQQQAVDRIVADALLPP